MPRELTFVAKGDSFKPSHVDFAFSDAIDAGAIAASGKYKGQPMPFGRASLVPPSGLEGRESLTSLCNLAAQIIPALRAAGADDFALWVLRDYEHQCNEELSPSELALIASLNCTLCYSAYQVAGDGA